MQAAIDAAVARNVVVVVAAGNKANRTALYAPANATTSLSSALVMRGRLAFYSNFGPEVDILAPGGDVFADTDNDRLRRSPTRATPRCVDRTLVDLTKRKRMSL